MEPQEYPHLAPLLRQPPEEKGTASNPVSPTTEEPRKASALRGFFFPARADCAAD